MNPLIGLVFDCCFPGQMFWVDAPQVTLTAMVGGMVFRCWWRSVGQLTDNSVGECTLALVSHLSGTTREATVRPHQTLSANEWDGNTLNKVKPMANFHGVSNAK